MQAQIPRSLISSYPCQNSHSRWLALTQRDPSFHSSFLYGVKSTKIYCRPTCSARLARRAKVVFYDTEDQARRDGFRPCRRCKPDDTTFVGDGEEVVAKVIALLRTKKDDMKMKSSLKELARDVGVTPSYVCRVFKKTMGVTLTAYMKEFEREASTAETESSFQSRSQAGSDMIGTGLPTLPIMTVGSASAPVGNQKGGPVEEDVGNVKQALDSDLDLDEWLWMEWLSSDNIFG